jgi:LysM repeat protein
MRPKYFMKFALPAMLFMQTTVFSQQGTQSVQHKKFTTQDYIERFKDIAIREMERSGIPASITLAQGIHESGVGNSRLAREANNHFGIKCHDWKGQGFYHWDDDPQESCFRVYENADSSYIDHTEFLVGRKRYAFLFEYAHTDYSQWAHGLKKAGYATDPEYPQKLIKIIERNNLQEYDLALSPMPLAKTDVESKVSPSKDIFVVPQDMQRQLRKKTKSTLFKEYKKGLYSQNGSTYAMAKTNETALEFATRFDIPYRKFLLFNDLVDGDKLLENQYCFIQPKKSKYRGSEVYHKVSEGESMYDISQYYGIKLQDLLDRNLLKEGQEPQLGEMVLLNEKAFKAPLLRGPEKMTEPLVKAQPKTEVEKTVVATELKTVTKPIEEKKALIAEMPTYPEEVYSVQSEINTAAKPEESYSVPEFPVSDFVYEPINIDFDKKKELTLPETQKSIVKVEEKPLVEIKGNNDKKYLLHIVQPKETLFSIGKKYGIGWENIKEYNNLASNILMESQEIKIPK